MAPPKKRATRSVSKSPVRGRRAAAAAAAVADDGSESGDDAAAAPPVRGAQRGSGGSWGRYEGGDALTRAACGFLLLICPPTVLYFWLAIEHYGGSLTAPALAVAQGRETAAEVATKVLHGAVLPTAEGARVFVAWLVLQFALYMWLPGERAYGSVTPAGYKLAYRVNGLLAWLVTHVLYVAGVQAKLWRATVVADHWGSLLACAQIAGYVVAVFAYVKARRAPTHAGDVKRSGSFVYDFFMGAEFNPRLFNDRFDFKLFFNGRPGIVAWTLVNLSFAAKQYERHGVVTNSMLLVNVLHAIYVLDFFYNENWYLRTIDICHDHFGWYLAWGDLVWLPFMYTLQSVYLARVPVELSTPECVGVLALGLFGYAVFRAVNSQKDAFRAAKGKLLIGGRPATFLAVTYRSSDGELHQSQLLTSGYWGMARHLNYIGDLAISTAYCLACGYEHVLPYFYAFWMLGLLVHRVYRDDARCGGKYGKFWTEYKRLVPYKIVPGVW